LRGGETLVDLNKLAELADSEAFFAVLFVAGLIYVGLYVKGVLEQNRQDNMNRENSISELYKEQLSKADQREEKLMTYLDKNNEQLQHVADTLSDVQTNLQKVEDRMEDNFMHVWKEIGQKQDKINGKGE
jgi:septal ring factor EnvC (AmiA/AmiB activator)